MGRRIEIFLSNLHFAIDKWANYLYNTMVMLEVNYACAMQSAVHGGGFGPSN